MTTPVRIDLIRAAERELRAAFGRGEFDADIAELKRGCRHYKQPIPTWLAELSKPGKTRDQFCYRFAAGWVAVATSAQHAGDVVAFVHEHVLNPPEPIPAGLRLVTSENG